MCAATAHVLSLRTTRSCAASDWLRRPLWAAGCIVERGQRLPALSNGALRAPAGEAASAAAAGRRRGECCSMARGARGLRTNLSANPTASSSARRKSWRA